MKVFLAGVGIGVEKFLEDAGAAGASVSGWTRRRFLCGQMAGG